MNHQDINLTEGSIPKGILLFSLPLFLGQLLQQLYNLADAWVVGNFAGTESFAAVASSGNLIFLIIGFFNGVAIGGGVIISRHFGAQDEKMTRRAVHTNILMGIISSIASTVIGLLITPQLLVWMNTPDSVMPYAQAYFSVYFGGVSTVIMYNICMSIMRALGDSVHPLYYLIISSVVNVVLDLLFVAVFGWDVTGAAVATVLAQGLSLVLCLIRMARPDSGIHLRLQELGLDWPVMRQVLLQGVPTGVQNSVISIGNLVVQSQVNSFGAAAMSGRGAYAKVEGFVFLPVMCMSMALPTFVSQNIGAGRTDRARKGALFGIASGVAMAELIGMIMLLIGPLTLRFFVNDEAAIAYGMIDIRTISLFYGLLAFSHCAAGVLRGCGRSIIPMVTMLLFWCGVRILYVTNAIRLFPVYNTISWAYPLTWACSTVLFLFVLLKTDWASGKSLG